MFKALYITFLICNEEQQCVLLHLNSQLNGAALVGRQKYIASLIVTFRNKLQFCSQHMFHFTLHVFLCV
jgi:hypothetical protein